ncbi:hypothetical protein BST27_20200 [Mycobacterium intermedium]|uniref:Transmembrane protein n=1 Tax=Mycobacterium intermedium TaxID=28445 RepID=A0A1E3SHV4_MYCIE|nr:B-4DMT family transporter [Mycobacterium intermedium]MCV6964930.1 B-4DMT family transporter [Mycobacterium intermedium]ODR01695.1 hypothetical protein BHQ20_07865 [Mycobacterium intermedium]OPE52216.1 hypothetical protein BV508_03340 [Mycobacterium intermedium]ORA98825.1 hypothetical protein BST27_20200 [Mycobacterium intermedium]
MRPWILRGLVFAAAMVVLRLFQGALINAWQSQSGLISLVLLLIYIVVVVAWGVRDGKADAKANPDPDRREDLAMVWLLSGLFAGVVSGFVAWLISLFYKGIYTGGLLSEVTTFAAFTALLIFVVAIIGVSVGRWLVDRSAPPPPKHDGSHDPARERGDGDVFSAVRDDDSPTGEIPRQGGDAQTEQRTSPVATVERDERTEVFPTGDDDKTQVIRTDEARTDQLQTDKDDTPTEVIRTDRPDDKK